MSRHDTKAKDELLEYLSYGPWGRLELEYHFHPERKWRADYALLDQTPPVLIEYDGIMRDTGRSEIRYDDDGALLPSQSASHRSVNRILQDQEKANEAQALGYRLYRCNAKSIQEQTRGKFNFLSFLGRVLEPVE